MGDFTAIKGLGAIAEKVRDGADLVVVLLKEAEADADLRKHATLDDVLSASGNTEADFTDYARKTISNGNVTLTEASSGDQVDVAIGNQVWSDAGGATNNTTAKLLICEDGTDDTDRVFLAGRDFVATTDGTDLTAVAHEDGFFAAADQA